MRKLLLISITFCLMPSLALADAPLAKLEVFPPTFI